MCGFNLQSYAHLLADFLLSCVYDFVLACMLLDYVAGLMTTVNSWNSQLSFSSCKCLLNVLFRILIFLAENLDKDVLLYVKGEAHDRNTEITQSL